MTRSTHPVVVIGGGLAGATTAEALRTKGYDGPIVLVSGEDHLPYERPPLSKEFMAGGKGPDDFTVHDANWYQTSSVDLRRGVTATAIDVAARTVTLSDGDVLEYSALVLATGSASARPPIPGSDADGVHYLRTLDEATALRDRLHAGARLAVIGAGWIGLEVAASARGRGAEVAVVEAADQPLRAALGPELGAVFADLHREHGVDLRLGTRVESIGVDSGRAVGVDLADGTRIDADTVLVAVGAAPRIDLAEAAGLDIVDRGVAVDAGLHASAPDVYAVGDIAAAQNPFLGARIRTEHWATALNQPAVVAENIVGGPARYDRLPYFFTDQYDLGMEYRGHAVDHAAVVTRGDVAGRSFHAFWLGDDDAVLAAMNVNLWDDGDDLAALVSARRVVDPTRLADPDVPLADLLA
ncbi:NAD(P)/FAD-dependent oxidoreductase [Gordonia shandongensis]|uniref:NAD(P)/FAD-dependent oxidoreductase n=1 Tax=Gordonia shandongensis TaxID=376351 RepID=UPI00041952D2|nr:FAD/NAD(P)-binding oxidoreductase [Gordonia shandongensis]